MAFSEASLLHNYKISKEKQNVGWNLWLSLLENGGNAHQLDEVVYYYRIHLKSRTTEADQNEQKLRLQILENHKELYLRQYTHLYDLHAAFCPSKWWFKMKVAINRLKNR